MREDVGEMAGIRWIDNVSRDGRYALRQIARKQMPGVKTPPSVHLVSMREIYASRVRQPLLIIVLAAAVLLAAACASIANLSLAKSASRAEEMSMRMALGGTRGRIAVQLLIETLVIAAVGGVVGMVLAGYGTSVLSSFAPPDLRPFIGRELSAAFLFCAFVITTITALACSLVPVVYTYRRDPARELRDGARAVAPHAARARQALAGTEMALATMLLAASALLLHSFVNVMSSDRGYDVEGVLTADLYSSARSINRRRRAPRSTATCSAVSARCLGLPRRARSTTCPRYRRRMVRAARSICRTIAILRSSCCNARWR